MTDGCLLSVNGPQLFKATCDLLAAHANNLCVHPIRMQVVNVRMYFGTSDGDSSRDQFNHLTTQKDELDHAVKIEMLKFVIKYVNFSPARSKICFHLEA